MEEQSSADRTVATRLPQAVIDELDAYADRTVRNRAQVIALAVRRFLESGEVRAELDAAPANEAR